MSGIRKIQVKQNSPEHVALISAGLKAARVRRDAGEGFIYVCSIPNSDAVKVGHTLFPERRAAQLGPGVRMLGYFPASIKAERALHANLRDRQHPDFDGREIYPRSVFLHPHSLPSELREAVAG